MFGCGIGGLGRRLRFRKQRWNSTRSPDFDAFNTEGLDYGSSCCSDRRADNSNDTSWMADVHDPMKQMIKRGFSTRDEPQLMTVNPNDVYFGNTLGRGATGTVYRGRLGCEDVAIKRIRKCEDSPYELGTGSLELHVGQSVNHPNVVKVLGVYVGNSFEAEPLDEIVDEEESVYESPYPTVRRASSSLFSDIALDMTDSPEEIWIVMEYCNRGSLREAIQGGEFFEDTERRRPRILHVLFAALEIAAAMEHLHSCGIVHGDLKSENVMLTTSQILAKNFVCKVGDFGMSRPFTQIATHISTFTAGTVSHMPPEVLRDGILTPSVDVFSFGMLLWELLAGELPFSGLNSGETMVSIIEGQRPEIPSFCPPTLVDLVRRCWEPKREDRPMFKDITRVLKTMLGGPPPIANKGIPVMDNAEMNSTAPSCSTDMFFSGEIGMTSSASTTTDLSDNGCLSVAVAERSLGTQYEEQYSEKDEETQRPHATTPTHRDSMIPKPPRIAAIQTSTEDCTGATTRTVDPEKETLPFPQRQAYLNAIKVSNSLSLSPSKTKIPTTSSWRSSPRLSRASTR